MKKSFSLNNRYIFDVDMLMIFLFVHIIFFILFKKIKT